MRRVVMKTLLWSMAMLVLGTGCATTAPKYSSYSTQQLRQELIRQKKQFSASNQAIAAQKQDYRDSVNGHPTFGTAYGSGAVGTVEVLSDALAARAASKKIDELQLELIRRGEWDPNNY